MLQRDAVPNGGTTTKAGPKRIRPDHEFSLHICAALALLLFARVAIAQAPAPAPATAEKIPAGPPKISYVDGQLKIDALNSTLAEVLAKVAALTGVTIDVPAGASNDRMPVVELGPGPARQILASLLSDSGFDYLIQGSDADSDKIKSVLLVARDKKGGGTNGTEVAARSLRSPYSRAGASSAKSEDALVADAQPENAAADASASNPASDASQPEQPTPPSSVAAMQLPLSQMQSNSLRPGALTPPPALNSQSINQQLQQMYQQRIQMTQQERQATSPAGRQ